MKKITFLILFLCSIVMNSQSLGYNDLGVLFTEDANLGTARFRGMGGAFGALGGDLNATTINPAGGAVFLNSEFSTSLDFKNETIESTYYGTNTSASSNYTNFSQVGGIFVFRTGSSNWSKTAIGFNYNTQKDFNSRWVTIGNSNYPTFVYDNDYTDDGDDTNDKLYLLTDGQYFDNYTSGRNDKYTFSFSSQYSDKLYIGASFIANDVRFYQSVYLEEDNNDREGNFLLGSLSEELSTFGSGFSFNFGIISKPTENIRLGLSYQSPTWYNLIEEFSSSEGLNGFDYSLKTPSKTTGSFAYIFNINGLISLDYAFRNYSNIKLTPDFDFGDENRTFNTDFKGTSEIRIGTEWRVKQLSLRGGYFFQENPYNNATSSNNLTGFSFGLGYNFGFAKIDVSYEESNQSSSYDFYPQYDNIEPAFLKHNNSIITTTLVFSI